MYLEGENDFNFIDTYARVVPDDDTGLELRGEFMGGEMQDGILSVDETGALYVSCEVDSDLVDGSISLLANLRHLDDENWMDDDFMPMPADAVAYYRGKTFMEIANTYEIDTGLIPDNGSGGTHRCHPRRRRQRRSAGELSLRAHHLQRRGRVRQVQSRRHRPGGSAHHAEGTSGAVGYGSSKSSKLTYDDIKAMLGGEDGIPHDRYG